MRRAAKYALIGTGSLFGIAALAAGTFYLNLLASRPQLDGDISVEGLHQHAVIKRDKNGAPLIEAADLNDAVFSMGFLHAQERYFQMDLMRKKAAGELAELFGARAVETDKLARLHRFRTRARAFVAQLPADQRTVLRQYVAGVNAGLHQLTARPFEYSLLLTSPTAWKEEDVLLVNMSMYLMLQVRNEPHPELIRQNLIAKYDLEFANFMQPSTSEWDSPMVGQAGAPATAALPALLGNQPAIANASLTSRLVADAALGPGQPNESIIGSNSWAVSGRKGNHGHAILANDMHLPLQQPNTFYRVNIKTKAAVHTIAGVSIPGLPILVAGSNGNIAWGLTNSSGDWSDLVRIPKNRLSTESKTVREMIAVKGGAPVPLDVQETRWGPVVSSDEQASYAMNWVAHHAEGNNLRLYALMAEPSLDGALRIASHAGMAHMNILVADARGNAAWTIAGRIPQRTGFAGTEPVEWGNGIGWSGWLDTPDYPVLTTANHDYLWTANNRILDGDAQKKIGEGSSYALGVRAMRIEQVLAASKTVNEADMHALQLDDVSLLMKRWHGLITQIVAGMPASDDKKILAETLSQWNGHADANSASYRVVRRFRDEVAGDLMTAALGKVLKSDPKLRWDMFAHNWELPLWQIVSRRPANMLPAGFTSWDAYFQDALVRRVYDPYKKQFNGALSKAVWGEANMSEIRHPLSKGIPLLGSLLDMPTKPMNGDSNVVLAQLMSFGPAMRLVVAPGQEQDGILTMPAGQASNPLTPYFGKGHDEWRRGKTIPLLIGKPQYVLRLSPFNNRP